MTPLLAVGVTELAPFVVFAAIVAGAWFLMNALTRRSSRAEERLDRLGRGQSSADLDVDPRKQRFSGLKDAIASIGGGGGLNELEQNKLKLKLTNAGFRSDTAPMIYQGLRVVCIALFLVPTSGVMLLMEGFTQKAFF